MKNRHRETHAAFSRRRLCNQRVIIMRNEISKFVGIWRYTDQHYVNRATAMRESVAEHYDTLLRRLIGSRRRDGGNAGFIFAGNGNARSRRENTRADDRNCLTASKHEAETPADSSQRWPTTTPSRRGVNICEISILAWRSSTRVTSIVCRRNLARCSAAAIKCRDILPRSQCHVSEPRQYISQ